MQDSSRLPQLNIVRHLLDAGPATNTLTLEIERDRNYDQGGKVHLCLESRVIVNRQSY